MGITKCDWGLYIHTILNNVYIVLKWIYHLEVNNKAIKPTDASRLIPSGINPDIAT